MSKLAVSSGWGAEQWLLHTAVERLRRTAWALAWALITVLCCVLALLSMPTADTVESGAMLLCASASGMCLLALADALIRLDHCGGLSQPLPPSLQRFISEQPFKPVPVHFVEQGAQAAGAGVESWIRPLTDDCADVREYASRQRQVHGFLRNADAVNVRLYAALRQRQRKAGCLAS